MSDQSTPVPDPAHPQQPSTPPAEQTAAIPQAAAVPAPPGWRPAAAPAPVAPSGPRRWWNEATSTGGGRAALAAVAVLAALFVVVGIGLTTALVLSHRGGDDRGFVTNSREGIGRGNGNGMGPGVGRGNGYGKNKGQGNGPQQAPGQAAPGLPNLPNGLGMGRGAGAALGAVLHGEFTTTLTGTPTVMVVQTGQVTAYTAGKSLTVKSTDGFQATYTLDATTPTTGSGSAALATGAQVHVLASKQGMKVTGLVVD